MLTASKSPHRCCEGQQESPSVCEELSRRILINNEVLIPFFHPLLFSNRVNASGVETLSSPEQTSRATMAAMVVPTTNTKVSDNL